MEEIPKKEVGRIVRNNLKAIVLSFLLRKPLYGYKLLKKIYWRCGVEISQGVLFPLLYKFEKEGIVSVSKKSNKRYYKLTKEGVAFAEQSVKQFLAGYHFLADLLEETVGEGLR